jgi:hypothetical protein
MHSVAQSDPTNIAIEEAAWLARIRAGKVDFIQLLRFVSWQASTDEPPERRELGERIYQPACDAFRDAKREECKEISGEVLISIFAISCGAYLTPDYKLRYSIVERKIGFDWSVAHALLDKAERLAARACELWPVDLASLREPPEGEGRELLKWLRRPRRVRRLARAKEAVAERETHCRRAYEATTSIFSAINMEKLNRDAQSNPQQAPWKPSKAFSKRVEIIRPTIVDAESNFERSAQRYARGRYGKGMVIGISTIGLICAALAIVFSIHHVPAWYGVALLDG